MPPSIDDRLKDIFDMVGKIERLTTGMSETDFAADETIRAATERFLGIACEASLRLPAEMKENHADIDWRAMNNFANLLRHGYHTVDPGQVWGILRNHLPKLKEFAERASRERD